MVSSEARRAIVSPHITPMMTIALSYPNARCFMSLNKYQLKIQKLDDYVYNIDQRRQKRC